MGPGMGFHRRLPPYNGRTRLFPRTPLLCAALFLMRELSKYLYRGGCLEACVANQKEHRKNDVPRSHFFLDVLLPFVIKFQRFASVRAFFCLNFTIITFKLGCMTHSCGLRRDCRSFWNKNQWLPSVASKEQQHDAELTETRKPRRNWKRRNILLREYTPLSRLKENLTSSKDFPVTFTS